MVAERDFGMPTNLDIPDALPVLPLRGGLVVFPMAVLPLSVGQPRSLRLVDDVMRSDRLVVLVAQRGDEDEQPGPEDIYRIGTVSVIHQFVRGDGGVRLIVQGLERVRLVDFTASEPYLVARVERAPERTTPGIETEGLRRAVLDVYRRVVDLVPGLSDELAGIAEQLTDARQVAYLIAATVPFDKDTRQELLELDDVDAKLRRLVDLLQHEIAVRELGQRITTETQERLTKTQRDYMLREQLRTIQRELGEGEEDNEAARLRRQLEEIDLPDTARREVQRELNRLDSIPPASPEYGIIRTYLEWIASLPWKTTTGTGIDVEHARQILDEDHYDLDKIKDRLLEYLAVRKLRQDRQAAARLGSIGQIGQEPQPEGAVGDVEDHPAPNARSETPTDRIAREPILCFVGPPGVGKTSLGQSIARALGRKFVRLSLGGIRDEAEIRGHRRTYIGAMPGRIIQGVKQAGAIDPVFLLDEVDKIGADWRGDPSSALLEVLDPAQNHTFVDHYLGVPFDLSQILFIATANTLETIPAPLLDRMEVLRLAGYTDEEKIQIAREYLVPKQVTAHGLEVDEIEIEPEAIQRIIRGYTREAGVRNLEREIAAVCRKVARDIAEGATQRARITADRVADYLGRPRFFDEVAERTDRPGVATGLAWTPAGGDVLFVEATMMPSREERLILTGMLGDVMRESAQAALSFIRSNAAILDVDASALQGKTVHLHVPAGAVPKDGPSAGVTMMTALASLVTNRPVRNDVAMTGEITLRGKVLPVGGIREKVLAARRMGIKMVILPRHNERDLEDVPEDLRQEMEFVLVDSAEEVLQHALPDSVAEPGVVTEERDVLVGAYGAAEHGSEQPSRIARTRSINDERG